MPRYDFQCKDCGAVKEYITGHDVTKTECSCGGEMNRLPHYSNVQLKCPRSFFTNMSDILPQTPEEKESWREVTGVRWV